MSKTLTGSYVGTYAFETNGGVGYTYDGQLTNLGTVTGGKGARGPDGYAGGIGILMTGGGLTNAAGHQISGGVGGYGFPPTFFPAGAGGAGVSLGSGASVANQGVITGGAGGADSVGGPRVGQEGDGVDAAGVALVANYGTIAGFIGVDGQGAGGLTVTNAGTIDGTGGTAVAFNAGTDRLIVQSGASFVGAVAGGGGTLELASGTDTISGLGGAGTLTGGATASFSGFAVYGVDAGAGLTLLGVETLAGGQTLVDAGLATNAGTLGVAGHVQVASGGSLVNLDGITDTVGGAVYVQDGGAVTNGSATNATALIEGYRRGISCGADATAANFGTIEALGGAGVEGVYMYQGQVTNGANGDTTALIQGAAIGVFLGDSVSVVNFGTILGGGGANDYGILFNQAGDGVNGSAGDRAALVRGAVGVQLYGAGTLTNYGTIDGTGGTAVQLFSASDVLVVEGGGTLIGKAVSYRGGTLELAGAAGAGTLTGLGTAFVGFDTITVDSGASWTLTGANSLSAGQSLTNSGTVTLTGTVTLSGEQVTNAAGAVWDLATDGEIALAPGDTGTFANAGLLEKTGGPGTSHLEATLTGAGSLDVETGTLELDGGGSAGGVITVAAGATLAVGAGTFTLNGGAITNAGTILADGAGASVALANADIQGGTLDTRSGGQILITGAGDTLDGSTAAGSVGNEGEIVLSGLTVYLGLTGEIDNTGTLQVQNDGHLYANTAGATLSGGGQVVMSDGIVLGYNAASTLTNVDNTIAGSGELGDGRLTLVNEAAGVIDATGVIFLQTSTFQNAGLLEATGAGKLDILDITVDDTGGGTISAGTKTAYVLLNGADVLGGTIGGVGVIETFGQASMLDGNSQAVDVTGKITVRTATTLTLEGTIDNTGQIVLGGVSGGVGNLLIGAAGVTLTGGGVVVADATGFNQISAAAPATLTNVNNRINGPGTLGDANLTLINEAGGIIYAGAASALTIDTGENIIQNAGLIEGYSAAGVVVKSAMDNTGNLVANGGNLTVDGAVTGSGVAHIYNGTLTFGAGFDETVIFSKNASGATSGELVLAQSTGFTAAIYGFSTTGSTSLDLQDIAFATASESYAGVAGGGTLTVTDGTHTAKIKLFGDFLGSSFDLSKDADGGVVVNDAPKAAAFTSAMASFGVSSHAAAAIGAGAVSTPTTRLAAPAYTG